jgi:hypothetical protein
MVSGVQQLILKGRGMGQRLGALCGGICRWSRILRTEACSVMKATIFISAPQLAHSKGSTS